MTETHEDKTCSSSIPLLKKWLFIFKHMLANYADGLMVRYTLLYKWGSCILSSVSSISSFIQKSDGSLFFEVVVLITRRFHWLLTELSQCTCLFRKRNAIIFGDTSPYQIPERQNSGWDISEVIF